MNIKTATIDNVTEMLVKIIDFTERRSKVLRRNIVNIKTQGYTPMDLDTEDFANIMTLALSEHIISKRLVMCDSDNIKFGSAGCFDVTEVADECAKDLFEQDNEKYMLYEVDKLSENILNSKLAMELLRQKHGSATEFKFYEL